MIAKLAHLHYARLLADALSHEEGSRSEGSTPTHAGCQLSDEHEDN